jgi:hypothetical protein
MFSGRKVFGSPYRFQAHDLLHLTHRAALRYVNDPACYGPPWTGTVQLDRSVP